MITTPGPELRHGGADGEFCMMRQTAHRPVGGVRLCSPLRKSNVRLFLHSVLPQTSQASVSRSRREEGSPAIGSL